MSIIPKFMPQRFTDGGDCWAASNLADLGAGVLTDLLEKGDCEFALLPLPGMMTVSCSLSKTDHHLDSGYASRQHLVSEALSLRASSGWLASQADGEKQDEVS